MVARVPQAEPAPEQSTLGDHAFVNGGKSFKLSTKAAVFKRVSLLIGGAEHVDWGGRSLWSPLGAGLVHKPSKLRKISKKITILESDASFYSDLVFYARFSLFRLIGAITS